MFLLSHKTATAVGVLLCALPLAVMAQDRALTLPAAAMGGDGWTCTLAGPDCTGADAAAAGQLVVPDQMTPTVTILTSNPNPSASGQLVTFTATVSPSSGPTGTVEFTADGNSIGCDAASLSSGTATCQVSSLTTGSYTVVAIYSGDSNYLGSSGSLTQVVTAGAATTTTVTSTENPSVVGNPVTFTASVSPSAATGTVDFTANDSSIDCDAVTLSGGTAACSTSSLSTGSYTIAATYSGDSNYQGSSGSLTQVVSVGTTSNFTISSNPSTQTVTAGNTATYTLTLTANNSYTGTVNLTCSGAPSDTSCNFSSSSVSLSSGSGSATLTIATTSNDGKLRGRPLAPALPFVAALALPFDGGGLAALLAGLLGRRRNSPRTRRALLVVALLLILLGLPSCAGFWTAAQQSYTITVTGTDSAGSGGSATATLTLTVDES
jgi:uncharacterized protein